MITEDKNEDTYEYGALVPVDRAIFIALCKYMSSNNLIDDFSSYLEKNNYDDIVIRLDFLTLFKKFLVESKRTDETALMAISCECQGGGGPGRPVCGVRG